MRVVVKVDWKKLSVATNGVADARATEFGGDDVARRALTELLGHDAVVNAVDYYVSGAEGAETARSVLTLLRSPDAMERCREIFKNDHDLERRRSAVELLRVVADRRVLSWIPAFLRDKDNLIQSWGVRIVDQLVQHGLVSYDDAAPILRVAAKHKNQDVAERAGALLKHAQPRPAPRRRS